MATPAQQTKYTQVIDEKTGEIKYVPENPPQQDGGSPGAKGKDEPDPARFKEDKDGIAVHKDTEEYLKDRFNKPDLSIDNKMTELLRMLEENNKRLRYDKRLQNGKLDGRRLVAYKTSDKLFKKKAIKHKDYQFTIMMDTSGSMFEGKLKIATEAAVKTVRSLEELNIPVSVVSMNNATYLVKGFKDKYDEEAFMEKLMFGCTGHLRGEEFCGGTAEATAYKETMEYIRKNSKEKTVNVVFVLSDGEPGTHFENSPVKFEDEVYFVNNEDNGSNRTESLRRYWERQTDVIPYGIGLHSDASQVPRSKRLDDIAKLPDLMNNLIQEILL